MQTVISGWLSRANQHARAGFSGRSFNGPISLQCFRSVRAGFRRQTRPCSTYKERCFSQSIAERNASRRNPNGAKTDVNRSRVFLRTGSIR